MSWTLKLCKCNLIGDINCREYLFYFGCVIKTAVNFRIFELTNKGYKLLDAP